MTSGRSVGRAPTVSSQVVAVALGGAAGACLRALIVGAAPAADDRFPWSTLAVNVLGTLLLALLPGLAAVRRRPLLPLLLGTGVLGGFTTLSAYSEQTRALAAAGHLGTAAAYVVTTLVACFAAVHLARHWVPLAGPAGPASPVGSAGPGGRAGPAGGRAR